MATAAPRHAFAVYGPEPGMYRTVGLPGGEATILRLDHHRQLIDTTPPIPGGLGLRDYSRGAQHGILEGADYGWAEIERRDGTRERWLLESNRWHRKLAEHEPDPVIEPRGIIR